LLADDARLQATKGTDFLDSPLERSPPSVATSAVSGGPVLPARVGRYRVVRLLGVGGMASSTRPSRTTRDEPSP
jgi:hypothetical protein